MASIGNWCSKTYDEDKFGHVDKRLDDELDIADLKLSQIMEMDREWVDNYNYYYRLSPITGQFDISFDVKFAPDTYQEIKNHLETSEEMEGTYCTVWSRPTGEEKAVSVLIFERRTGRSSIDDGRTNRGRSANSRDSSVFTR